MKKDQQVNNGRPATGNKLFRYILARPLLKFVARALIILATVLYAACFAFALEHRIWPQSALHGFNLYISWLIIKRLWPSAKTGISNRTPETITTYPNQE
jgi:small-conductance mechanosensitive channel